MKLLTIYLGFALLVISFSCTGNNVPNSIKISSENVYFFLKDKDYRIVDFGSNVSGKWSNIPMKKIDSFWVIEVANAHKLIEYKFHINKWNWLNDPLNNRRVKLKYPFEGYNSIISLK